MRRIALVLVVGLAACRPQSVNTRMWNHYQHVATVEAAVIGTNLDAAKQTARWVATHQETDGLPAAARPYLDSMRMAALAVNDAADLDIAALAAARMGASCGACHAAAGRGPRVVRVGAPPSTGDTIVSDRMAYHLWAANRMWNGLTAPSDEAWAAGAVALTDLPRFQAHIRRPGPRGLRSRTRSRSSCTPWASAPRWRSGASASSCTRA